MNNKKRKQTEQGFSLVEAVASLTLLTICLAFSMPLFLYARISTIKSEQRTGAIIVSQEIMDNIRQKDLKTLPNTTTTAPVSPDPTAMGNTYNATLYYCENTTYCNNESRQVRVEITKDGSTEILYSVEAVYTQFD